MKQQFLDNAVESQKIIEEQKTNLNQRLAKNTKSCADYLTLLDDYETENQALLANNQILETLSEGRFVENQAVLAKNRELEGKVEAKEDIAFANGFRAGFQQASEVDGEKVLKSMDQRTLEAKRYLESSPATPKFNKQGEAHDK
jgi:hypothetical protein